MVGAAVSLSPDGEGTAIMLFARVPVPGQVKTRLIPALGALGACRLHQAMLDRGLNTVVHSGAQSRQLWLAGENRAKTIDDLALVNEVSVHWQRGENIGVRMAQAFQQNFTAGFGRVIVAGSDCPLLTVGHYDRVLQGLQHHDAVIIPALDGGYVLLGLRRWDESLFSDVRWGTETVFQSTVAKLESMGWGWCALPPLPDIDRLEDLVHLQGLALEY